MPAGLMAAADGEPKDLTVVEYSMLAEEFYVDVEFVSVSLQKNQE